jgi:hypothetical protein
LIIGQIIAGATAIEAQVKLSLKDSNNLQIFHLIFSALIAYLIGLFSYKFASNPDFLLTGPGGDFSWAWRAAHDLLAGRDPYAYPVHVNAIPYPLPAAFIGIPFTPLSVGSAGALFIGISSSMLSFGLTKNGKYWKLLVFLSSPYIEVIKDVQWAALMMTVALYSDFLFLSFAKPQLGIASAIFRRPTRRGTIIALTFLLLSLLVYPSWPIVWLSQTTQFGGYVPVLLFGGPILLLSLFKWKTPNGRYLLSLSLLPKRALYDATMLWLIPEHWSEALLLTFISWIVSGLLQQGDWNYIVVLYLTALIFVLRPREWLFKKTRNA